MNLVKCAVLLNSPRVLYPEKSSLKIHIIGNTAQATLHGTPRNHTKSQWNQPVIAVSLHIIISSPYLFALFVVSEVVQKTRATSKCSS